MKWLGGDILKGPEDDCAKSYWLFEFVQDMKTDSAKVKLPLLLGNVWLLYSLCIGIDTFCDRSGRDEELEICNIWL